MRKKILSVLITILSFNSFAQISFQKGYFISNNEITTECYIKNIDWKNNPTEFEYKLSEIETPNKATINSVKEFGILNESKFIRAKVNIDRSSQDLNNLSGHSKPILKEEIVFLKVLVEGEISLYEYTQKRLKRFFYSKDKIKIEQLIYKRYLKADDKIGENKFYQQQLFKSLKCKKFNFKTIKNVDYRKNDLLKLFKNNSDCLASPLSYVEPKRKQKPFKLSIRPRLNHSSLEVKNDIYFKGHTLEFDNKTGFGVGLEAEYILPFNKNKWALIFEPTYQSFKSEGQIYNLDNTFGREIHAKIEYRSIEIPIGFRHYFFLNNNSTIFINASLVYDINLKSSFSGNLSNASIAFSPLEKAVSTENFAAGIGYKLYDKFNVELRYQTGRHIIDDKRVSYWLSNYRTISVIFGYSIF